MDVYSTVLSVLQQICEAMNKFYEIKEVIYFGGELLDCTGFLKGIIIIISNTY